MHKTIWSFLFLLISIVGLQAQPFYTHDIINPSIPTNDVKFKVIDSENCTQGIWDSDLSTIQAVASLGNDTLLFYSYSYILDFIANEDGPGLYKYRLPYQIMYLGTVEEDTTIAGMTHGPDGLAYMAGLGLSTYDNSSQQFQYLGNFPTGMQAGGDIVFRDGRLYMTTTENELVKVNTSNPALSEVVHVFPDSLSMIQGLANFPFRCDSTITYIVTADSAGVSHVYDLDFDDFSITNYCELPGFHQDAATDMEYLLPPCEIFTDLDIDDSSGATAHNYYRQTCAGPVVICDEDVQVFTPFPLDSLKVSLTGVLDAGAEKIFSSGGPGVGVQTLDDTTLLLVNQEDATEEDFQLALLNTFYENEAVIPTLGTREIVVSMHSSFYGSMPSITTIEVDTVNMIALEESEFSSSCWQSNDATAILQGINGAGPYTYTWPDGDQSAMRDDLAPGIYDISIQDAEGCANVDSVYITEPDSLIASIQATEDSICSNNGQLIAEAVGGTSPYSYEWSPASGTNDTLSSLLPGTYTLQLTDSLGCTAQASYTLYPADTIFTNTQLSACEGTPISWQGQEYSSDTTICIAGTSVAGCDSIHCVNLIFQDTFYQEESYALCAGESLQWQGSTYSQDTSLCQVYTNSQGCDSTYCLQLSFLSRVGEIEAQVCEGETYDFNGQLLTQAGTYTDTINDGGVCDSLAVLQLSFFPPSSASITTEGSLCVEEEVTLLAGESGQYAWSTGGTTPSINVEESGKYYLTLTDANGCIGVDSILLNDEAPALSVSITDPNCPGFPNGQIQADSSWGGSPPYLYSLNGNPLQSQPGFSNLEAGTYTLTVEDIAGCSRTYDLMLSNQSSLSFSLGADISLNLGDRIQLQPSVSGLTSLTSALWRPSDYLNCDTCLAPISKPLRSITYQAAITDSLGCTLTDDITITVEQKEGLYIPNAFSPNGDGRNDRLAVFGDASIASINRFQVFNRWGGLVYERKDFLPNTEDEANWDGVVNGSLAPVGVYIYQVEYSTVAGEELVAGGEIHLLR